MLLNKWLSRLFGRGSKQSDPLEVTQAPLVHVVILDGTLSSLELGCETNAGLIYKLIDENPQASVYYEAGLQWTSVKSGWDVMVGKGINRQIQRAYSWLATHYREGDKIILVGYSRGAYAVRSLAGVIDRVGLLSPEHVSDLKVQDVYQHYRQDPDRPEAKSFAAQFCRPNTPIEAVAVFDTVKALGIVFPVLWRLSEKSHAFHSHALGDHVRHGFHALALNETRVAYRPIMWRCPTQWPGHMQQMWFCGSHGDIGGHLNDFNAARPLSNIPLIWMGERLEKCDVKLPNDWQVRFVQNPDAPSVGNWRGFAKMFLTRRKRKVGNCRTEQIHQSVQREV